MWESLCARTCRSHPCWMPRTVSSVSLCSTAGVGDFLPARVWRCVRVCARAQWRAHTLSHTAARGLASWPLTPQAPCCGQRILAAHEVTPGRSITSATTTTTSIDVPLIAYQLLYTCLPACAPRQPPLTLHLRPTPNLCSLVSIGYLTLPGN